MMNEERVKEFMEQVDELGDKIDEVLADNDVMICLATLARLIGTGLAVDVVGQVPGLDTYEDAMKLFAGGIHAAYKDAQRNMLMSEHLQ